MRLSLILVSVGSLAAAPVLRDIEPHGAQRGKSLQLVLKGSDLKPGARLLTTLPASVSRLAPSKDLMRPDTELPFLVEIRKDAPVGLYPVRVHTSDGLSNVLLFSVGDLPEQAENESKNPRQSNNDLKSAEVLAWPAVVNGTLTEADVDVYAIDVKAGQKLVFEVEANATASAIDAAMELLDSSGKTLAKNDDAPGSGIDPRFEYAFAKPGRYYLRLHDSKYSDQAANFYRLKVGAWSYAEGLYPLGWRRGEPVAVAAVGGNLPQPVMLRPDRRARLVRASRRATAASRMAPRATPRL